MLRSWGKSSPKSQPPKHQHQQQQQQLFRCSSFKDIETLNNNNNNITITRNINTTRTAVLHRANTFIPKKTTNNNNRITIYYTSLRVIRSTFDSCRSVLSILQGFRVPLDLRDLAMDSTFSGELRDLLSLKPTESLSLPRVFLSGRYIGGADDVKHLHEIGELKTIVSCLPVGKITSCAYCGGHRFVLCHHCDGSRKVFGAEKTGFRSCGVCNENGLLRCPHCFSLFPPR